MMKQFLAFLVSAALLAPGSQCWDLSMDDARMMAKCLYGECLSVESTEERAAVAWCILNRVDDPRFPDTIRECIGQPSQFTGYRFSNPVDEELLLLSMDVIIRWQRERNGETDVGRVLPSEYVYFVGRDGRNHFSTNWPVSGKTWDWSLEDPYEEGNDYVDDAVCVDEHDEPADALDRNYAQLRRAYRRVDDGLVD